MANWKYRLEDEGKKLREIVDREENDNIESCIDTLKQLKVCCTKLLNQLKIVDKNNYENEIENLIDEIDLLGDLEEYDIYSALDEVNYNLRTFYDICDDCKCWISL